MSLETDLVARLKADAALSPLVGARIYADAFPKDPTYPAIVYQLISRNDDYTQDGPSGLVDRRIQIDCYAAGKVAVIDLSDKVIASLNGYRGVMGGTAVRGVFLDNERDQFPQDLLSAGKRPYRRILDFIIWYGS